MVQRQEDMGIVVSGKTARIVGCKGRREIEEDEGDRVTFDLLKVLPIIRLV